MRKDVRQTHTLPALQRWNCSLNPSPTRHASVGSWLLRARIARWRRCVIRLRWWPEDFGEDRFQAIGPDLIALQTRMQFVFRYTVKKFSVLVRQFVVHVEVTNLFSVRDLREVVVDAIDRRD